MTRPGGPIAARTWLNLSLRAADPEAFRAAAEAVSASPPEDKALRILVERRADVADHLTPVVRTLLVENLSGVLPTDVAWPVIDQMLAAEKEPSRWADVVLNVRTQTQRYAGSVGLRQAAIVANHAAGRLRAAADLADAAVRSFPQDVTLRQLQLAAYIELKNWKRVTEIGGALAELSPRARAVGLLAEAEAWVQLKDGDAALASLERLAREGKFDPVQDDVLRRVWLRARMVRGDDPTELDGVVDLVALPVPQLGGLISELMLVDVPEATGRAWADWFTTRIVAVSATDSDGPTAAENPSITLALAAWWRTLHERHGTASLGERALPLLATLVDDPEQGPLALRLQGQLFELLGRDPEARSAYTALLERRPDDLIALNNLAMVLSRLGESERAVALAERVSALAPGNAAVYDTYAETLRAADRPADAVAAARKAVELAPNEESFAVTLGMTLCEAGDTVEARQVLEGLLASPRRRTENDPLADRIGELKAALDGAAAASARLFHDPFAAVVLDSASLHSASGDAL